MTTKEIFKELKALANEKVYAQNLKNGAGENQFGVRMGEIRKVAKKIKTNHKLALELWDTENIEARLLATLLIKPKELSIEEMDEMVKSVEFYWLADWLNAYVVKKHPENEKLRIMWMNDTHPMAARAGWNLTSQRVSKNPEVLNIDALLTRLESEMAGADSNAQWTMNFTLAEIGINFPEYRERALAIGEKLGIYRDFPVSKGCTSPFAPIWINEMVRRQQKK